jgi:transcriptional regulator GlxA family with amidase domain
MRVWLALQSGVMYERDAAVHWSITMGHMTRFEMANDSQVLFIVTV